MRPFLICYAIMAAGASAAENGPIRICVEHRALVSNFVLARAQTVVNAVFSDADIQVEWLPSRLCMNPLDQLIRIEMDSTAPSRFSPETMAYALPYSAMGTTIHIFCDRVLGDHRDMPAEMLGHVIAHEIGHILEGIARHSPEGLMKPHWNLQDYWRMKKRRLFFAPLDVELMHLHAQAVSAGSATAPSERE